MLSALLGQSGGAGGGFCLTWIKGFGRLGKRELVWAHGLSHCCKTRSGTGSGWRKRVLDPLVHSERNVSMIHWLQNVP